MKIAILSVSVRTGRASHRVALYFKNYIKEHKLGSTIMLDLNEYQFPVFEERLKNLKSPSQETLQFAENIKSADAIIIVTPEYNGGYPASLKNVIDLLYSEWKRKPIAIATVSSGQFGGSQVITSLLFTLWKIGAYVVPAKFLVSNVEESYSKTGKPTDKDITDKNAKLFLSELLWYTKAKQKMD